MHAHDAHGPQPGERIGNRLYSSINITKKEPRRGWTCVETASQLRRCGVYPRSASTAARRSVVTALPEPAVSGAINTTESEFILNLKLDSSRAINMQLVYSDYEQHAELQQGCRGPHDNRVFLLFLNNFRIANNDKNSSSSRLRHGPRRPCPCSASLDRHPDVHERHGSDSDAAAAAGTIRRVLIYVKHDNLIFSIFFCTHNVQLWKNFMLQVRP